MWHTFFGLVDPGLMRADRQTPALFLALLVGEGGRVLLALRRAVFAGIRGRWKTPPRECLARSFLFLALLGGAVGRVLLALCRAFLVGVLERWQTLRLGVLGAQLLFWPCWLAKLTELFLPSAAGFRRFPFAWGLSVLELPEDLNC